MAQIIKRFHYPKDFSKPLELPNELFLLRHYDRPGFGDDYEKILPGLSIQFITWCLLSKPIYGPMGPQTHSMSLEQIIKSDIEHYIMHCWQLLVSGKSFAEVRAIDPWSL